MMQTSQRHTPYSTSLQTFQRSSSYNGFSELLTTSPSSIGSYNSYYNPTSFYSASYPPQQSTAAALLGAGNSYYYQQQQPATTSCTTTSYVTDSPNVRKIISTYNIIMSLMTGVCIFAITKSSISSTTLLTSDGN